MPTYFPVIDDGRVSFWDNNVEHTVTSDGLTISASEHAEALVESGVLKTGEPTDDTKDAIVYDVDKDESVAYALAFSAQPHDPADAPIVPEEELPASSDAPATIVPAPPTGDDDNQTAQPSSGPATKRNSGKRE